MVVAVYRCSICASLLQCQCIVVAIVVHSSVSCSAYFYHQGLFVVEFCFLTFGRGCQYQLLKIIICSIHIVRKEISLERIVWKKIFAYFCRGQMFLGRLICLQSYVLYYIMVIISLILADGCVDYNYASLDFNDSDQTTILTQSMVLMGVGPHTHTSVCINKIKCFHFLPCEHVDIPGLLDELRSMVENQ